MNSSPPPDTLSMLERVDAASDSFERQWLEGAAPRIEDYLAAAPAGDHAELLRALIGVELELRSRQGESVRPEAYASRFPEQQQIVAEVFVLAGIRYIEPPSAGRTETGNTISLSSPSADTSIVSPASAAPPERLEKLGRFDLLEVLGEGAFGTVYRAHDPELDRLVAIKVPRAGVLRTPDDHQRFRREARAAARLDHPYICQVYEVGELDGLDYIVMAYVEGKPLAKIIKAGKVQSRQAAAAVRKLALALAEAHRQGIVHRDLKPANIMVNSRGEPVVMDFGLARLHQPGDAQITRSGAIMGSPAYMSPEQARGDTATIGPASDIYSLGVILYELLTGRRPFEGSVTEVLGKILHVEPEPPSSHRANLDPRLEAICLKAMAKSPAARYGSMEDLAQELGNFVKTASPNSSNAPLRPIPLKPADPGSTQFVADMFANVSAGLQTQSRELGRRHTRLMQLVAAGFALTVLAVFAGIWFFARNDTVTVLIQIPIDIKDPALRFYLDKELISEAKLAAPIELKPGEHELVVHRDGQLYRRFLFHVGQQDNQPITVQDVTPKPPEPPQPPPTETAAATPPSTLPIAPAKPADDAVKQQAIGLIKQLRGKYKEDPALPGNPITELHLAGTKTRDIHLQQLAGMTEVEVVDLNGCFQVGDEGLAALRGMKNIHTLILWGCHQVTDDGFEHLQGLKKLRTLNIGYTGVNEVSGSGLVHLRNLPALRSLVLNSLHEIEDRHLQHLSGLVDLENLGLGWCKRVSNEGLLHIRGLTNLRELDLSGSKVTDEGLQHLSGMKQLKTIYLRQSKVTDDGVASLQESLPGLKVVRE